MNIFSPGLPSPYHHAFKFCFFSHGGLQHNICSYHVLGWDNIQHIDAIPRDCAPSNMPSQLVGQRTVTLHCLYVVRSWFRRVAVEASKEHFWGILGASHVQCIRHCKSTTAERQHACRCHSNHWCQDHSSCHCRGTGAVQYIARIEEDVSEIYSTYHALSSAVSDASRLSSSKNLSQSLMDVEGPGSWHRSSAQTACHRCREGTPQGARHVNSRRSDTVHLMQHVITCCM